MAVQINAMTTVKGNTVVGFSPASLFAAGEQGVWYDPSDLSTMFQDAAGTTPVTAVEQPVGLIRDKSSRGNHATQSTAGSRPVLSARVNLLTKTEQFDDASWTKDFLSVSANAKTSPNGTATACRIIPDTANNYHVLKGQAISVVSGVAYTSTVYANADQISKFDISCRTNLGAATFDLVAKTATTNSGSSSSIVDVGNGWFKCSVTRTSPSSSTDSIWVIPWNAAGNAILFTGNGTDGIYLWGADLRPTNDGVGLPPYQRVNTSTDYDTVGFPYYLRFDGVNDSLATGSINFTSTDKVTSWFGIRKQDDESAGMVLAELSPAIGANNGVFSTFGDIGSPQNSQGFYSKGTQPAYPYASVKTAPPYTRLLTCIGDISAPLAKITYNAITSYSSSISQGTGNYGNYPLYLGARAGSSLYFNGRIYSLIVRGAASSAQQIAATEAYVNSLTRAY